MRISVHEIEVGHRLRQLRSEKVAQLAESIGHIGLQTPVSVRSDVVKPENGGANGVSFLLVAGLHRLEACKQLGWDEIDANVVHMDKDEILLWEIDENLCRADLTELERGEHLMRRKKVYERKWPQTRAGLAQAAGMNRAVGNDVDENFSPTFTADTADKTGISQRAVQLSIRRVAKIDDRVRDRVRALPEIADSGVELDALAKLEPAQQRRAVSMVESGTVGGIREARKIIAPPTPHIRAVPNSEDQELAALLMLWNKSSEKVKERFLAEIGAELLKQSA